MVNIVCTKVDKAYGAANVIRDFNLGPSGCGKSTLLRMIAGLEDISGGQQQRMAIARAMIKTPRVFLFDEPLSNLDAKLRNHMRVEIARLHQSLKTTTIYVTHDQLEAMTLADRIVLMKGARLSRSARRRRSTSGRTPCSSPASSARRT